eukprot:2858419-Pyramimonas_sp.AAC.1
MEYRLAAGRSAWYNIGRFLNSKVPFGWKINLLKGYVANACYSGAEVLCAKTRPMRAQGWQPILSFLAMRAKILLRGVVQEKEDGTIRTLSNLQVLTRVRLVAPHVEMRVRRLRWLQQCLRKHDRFAQFLAV